MQRGVRWINGQEYLLAGRGDHEAAMRQATELRKSWNKVRVVKRNDWDYMLYVHDGKQYGPIKYADVPAEFK